MNKLPAVLAVPMLVVFLTGCGSSDSAADDTAPAVASVSRTPETASSSAPAKGPRARLDTTAAEKNGWARAYWQCMKDNGARVDDSEKAKAIGFVDPTQATPEMFAACASKKPNFVPEEMDPDLNPNYKKQWHEFVKCLQGKGMPIVETDDGWSWESSNVVVPPEQKQDEFERECQIKTFARG
ncbi:hypothetical protein ACH495_30220 [Micromonospora sp. NPDC018662]|uniref:hypothetical protein n=1 Tax=Micromonospora sp. NPDC018662 TaxID=3364238 RepID=UPI0037A0DDA1